MKNLLGPEALIRRRLRQSAEVLVDDSSLRSNLSDAQAQQLLDWGMAQVQETAAATINLSDAEAYPLLEEKVAVVRRVMRLVSRLMAEPGSVSGDDLRDYLDRLLESLQQLAGQPSSATRVTQAAFLESNWTQLDGDTTYQWLMELIQYDDHRTSDEEE